MQNLIFANAFFLRFARVSRLSCGCGWFVPYFRKDSIKAEIPQACHLYLTLDLQLWLRGMCQGSSLAL